MTFRSILTSLALTAFLQPAAAATIQVEGGELVGATDLQAGDAIVDVSFVDGSCAEVFDGCDELSDFQQFENEFARSILEAIRDDVIVDGAAGAFDSNALLTRGCERGVRNLDFGCGFALPLVRTGNIGSDFIPGAVLGNLSAGTSGIDKRISFGSVFQGNTTQAVWVVVSNIRTDVAAVPLPASLPMIAVALFAIGAIGRRVSPTRSGRSNRP